jgi:ATP-binding cassette subfamily F protein 3
VSFEVRAGDRIGLIGRNGEGKTSLLRILAGQDTADDGRVMPQRGTRIGYLRQEIDPGSERTVLEETASALSDLHGIEAELRALEQELARSEGEVPTALAERYDLLERSFTARGGFAAEARMQATLTGLGLGPASWQAPLSSLSGGWLMRVELAKLLLRQPELLLLDEPTNHLDLPSIAWFEQTLTSYPGGVIVVSHDRAFLDRHVNRIAALEGGRLTVYTGNYLAYEEQKARNEELRESRVRALDRQIEHASGFVARFGASASRASQAQSRVKQIEKLAAERATLAPVQARRTLRFDFPPGVRSGETALRMESVQFAYPEAPPLYRDLNLELRRGERIALVGPNGAGKSTLLRLAAGELAPAAGTVELGHNVRLGYFAQHQLDALEPRRSVYDELEAQAPLDWVPKLRALLGMFLFSGDDVRKKIAVLSGGERARVALAKLFLCGANVLVLDEPTNHLDIQARDVLGEALARFQGTLLFISHDRRFIESLATRIVAVYPGESGARVDSYSGKFSEYERLSAAAAAPSPTAPAALRKSGAPSAPPRAESERAAPAAAPAAPRAPALSGNARRKAERECRETEEAIAELEQELEQLDALFADPAIARDGVRVRNLRQQRELMQAELRELYARWEELEQALAPD